MNHHLLRRIVVVLVALAAAGFAFVAASKRTPLPSRPPVTEPARVVLDAYRADRLQFPGERWEPIDPESLGWSAAKLEEARRWAEGLDSSAVMVVHRGVAVATWGEVERRYLSQSIRKSLLSALIGRLVADGSLDLDATLEELGIDDHPPLAAAERQATVRDLLLTRSGVYHSAIYEAGSWKRNKPERGAHQPGEAWFYNNWGFNALGTIFEKVSGRAVGAAFHDWVAEPIGMEDCRAEDVVVLTRDTVTERLMGNESDHPAHVFEISARDLARFGLLYLAGGEWDGRQVLPEGWVETSTVEAALPTGWEDHQYGYMWWVEPPSAELPHRQLVARGGRGHFLVVVPDLELVVVHRVPARGAGLASQLHRRFVWAGEVSDQQVDELVLRIVAAMPAPPRKLASGTPPASPPSPS